MVKTKTTPRGGKSHRPKGMATATFTSGTDADPEQQFQHASGGDTEDSQDWPEYGEEATQEEGEASTSKSKGKTGDQPKQEEQMPLPRKLPQHQNLPIRNQVPARIPLMPQLRFPSRTPPSQPSKTPMRKPHQTLWIMSKLTNRQEKYG